MWRWSWDRRATCSKKKPGSPERGAGVDSPSRPVQDQMLTLTDINVQEHHEHYTPRIIVGSFSRRSTV